MGYNSRTAHWVPVDTDSANLGSWRLIKDQVIWKIPGDWRFCGTMPWSKSLKSHFSQSDVQAPDLTLHDDALELSVQTFMLHCTAAHDWMAGQLLEYTDVPNEVVSKCIFWLNFFFSGHILLCLHVNETFQEASCKGMNSLSVYLCLRPRYKIVLWILRCPKQSVYQFGNVPHFPLVKCLFSYQISVQ